MSLDYTTLQAQIVSDTHRTDLTARVPDFIRQAEGVINRRLRCKEMLKRVDLTDTDRVTADEGFYNLPADFLEWRSFFIEGNYQRQLTPVSLAQLRTYSKGSRVDWFTVISDGEVEFRGVPSTSDIIELVYFARPDALTVTSTNDILTRHEVIYLSAAKSALYTFTQDLELASVHGQIADDAIDALNDATDEMLGGAETAPSNCFQSSGAR